MKKIVVYFIIIFTTLTLNAQQLAFPEAVGFGKYASGGRNGEVCHVTNLNNQGAGSFRAAVSQPNRTIVFDISGVIKIQSKVQVASNITIAGQTAPGKGIVIYGDGVTFSNSKNVIVRYIRFRGSIHMSRGTCTLIADRAENMIFDHVSVQWGRWDNFHIKYSNNITLQNCIIGEAIDPQRFGALLERPTNLSIYNSLWIDNTSRNPKAKAKIEFVNNVIYNWGRFGFVGGHSAADHFQDLINNYFIAGPDSNGSFSGFFTKTDHVYAKGNFLDLNKNGKLDGTLISPNTFSEKKATLLHTPTIFKATKVLSAKEAYYKILKEAGCSIKRDEVDKRLIKYLSSLGKKGQIFKTEQASGGQQPLPIKKAKKDTDQDGIPDEWEKKNNLQYDDKKDASTLTSSGYTNLEEYINTI